MINDPEQSLFICIFSKMGGGYKYMCVCVCAARGSIPGVDCVFTQLHVRR